MATLLFVEDESGIIDLGSRSLERDLPGLRVLKAETGAEGLALARAHRPDVVLLDLGLPGVHGLDLIAPLRSQSGSGAPAILIFTGQTDEATLLRVRAAGVAGLMGKIGVTGAEMAMAVQTVLSGGRYLSPRLATRFAEGELVAVPAVRCVPAVRERIVVVKGDRLRAAVIAEAAREACPAGEVIVCHSAADAVVVFGAEPAALGLIGLDLPDRDGLDLVALAGRERWCGRLMVVSGRSDERTRHVLRTARIDEFFNSAREEVEGLVHAIRRVRAGGYYLTAGALDPVENEVGALAQILTETELQVFAVIGAGLDDAQAAEVLDMGEATVQSHRKHVMKKLRLHHRSELMREALRRGVVRFTPSGEVLTPGLGEVLAARGGRSRDRFGPARPSRAAGK
ncbi:MAG: response regulator transcription factor [Undibacterium sp.]|nr:response regulator transcription factor [Opitutaceae bacterium]